MVFRTEETNHDLNNNILKSDNDESKEQERNSDVDSLSASLDDVRPKKKNQKKDSTKIASDSESLDDVRSKKKEDLSDSDLFDKIDVIPPPAKNQNKEDPK